MKKLVIFDLDGTLVDTINDLATACNHALLTLGFPTHHVSTYQFYVGNGVSKLIERALPSDSATPDVVTKAKSIFMEYYDVHCTDASKPYEGIHELLRQLRDHDVHLAVASNKYQKATEHVVRTLFPDIPWAAVEGQKNYVNVKPDPSVVFEVLSKCPTPKNEVLMVGDSGVDMETARRACIDSAGVTWGFRPEKEIVEAGARYIINRPGELLPVVLG